MIEQVIFVLLTVFTLWLAVAKRAYGSLGFSKHQSRSLNHLAQHKAFLAQLTGLKLALFLSLDIWLAFDLFGVWSIPIVLVLIILVFFWIPQTDPPKPLKKSALIWAGPINAGYQYFDWLEKSLAKLAQRTTSTSYDSGVYTLDDLEKFIKRQSTSKHNKITKHDLDKLSKRLEFETKKISDIMTGLSQTRIVGASETIGPILINELHEQDQHFFPVQEEFNKEIIGLLELRKLASLQKKSGNAKDAMNPKIEYINQTSPARQVLDSFFKIGMPVFIVQDDSKKPVGIITVDQTIRGLME